MAKIVKMIPRGRITNVEPNGSVPAPADWEARKAYIGREGGVYIMDSGEKAPGKHFLLLLDWPNAMRTSSGDLYVSNGRLRLITRHTIYEVTTLDGVLTDAKIRGMLAELDRFGERGL